MKKFTPFMFIATSFVALAFMLNPIVSFAENDNHQNDDNNKNKINLSANAHADIKLNEKAHSNSNFFGKLFGWSDNDRGDVKSATVSSVDASLTPTISGVTAPTVLKTGETGTWTVNASDPKNGSLSYSVDWGDNGAGPFARMFSAPVFVQTSTFTHAYAKAGTYKVNFTVSSTTGQKTTSSTTVHVTGSSSVNAPVISNLSAIAVRPHQATIIWETDVKASSSVWFSITSPVNTSGNANVSRTRRIRNHKIRLKKLEPNTKYYVVVGSADSAGATMSSEISFTTPAISATAPVITSLSGPTTVVAGTTATVTVNAYDPKNGSLSYSADWGDSMSIKALSSLGQSVFVQSATFNHVYSASGTYTATFTVKNKDGQQTSSSMNITVTAAPVDTIAPIISNIHTTVTAIGSTIAWTTDEPTTSKVFYTTTTPVDVNLDATARVSNTTSSTDHSISITGLTASTLYHFVIQATDGSNNAKLSSEGTFTTTSS